LEVRDVCRKYGLPEQIVEVLRKSGITKLYPPQSDAIKKGALNGKNLVLAVPTAAGKTLVSELCMLKSVLKEGGKCLYIVPLRALASEKYEEFKEKYGPLGVKVGLSTGDLDTVDPRLAHYDILIATSEKVDSLLRHRAKWLADIISVVVLDEIHLINDPGRGPTLEILTARLRQVKPELQALALSATIKNADEIAEWLGAELVKSDWRPVPLKKGVYYREKIKFNDGSKRAVRVKVEEDLGALAIDTVREDGQALVFVNTRRSAQAAAMLLARHVKGALSPTEREQLAAVAKTIEGALGESTRTCRQLADCVRQGVAFHHAGLHHVQRKAVEDAFKQNLIKVICATPTLAAGINLPSRRTIIRDYRRYVEPYGLQLIPVLEFHQMCLPYSTRVTLGDGSVLPIGFVVENKIPKKVLSYNPSRKNFEFRKIREYFSREAEDFLEIETSSGHEIQLTPEHPILTQDGWKPARTTKCGEFIGYTRAIPHPPRKSKNPLFYQLIPPERVYLKNKTDLLQKVKSKCTRRELAEKLNLKVKTVKEYVRGRKAIPLSAILAICDMLQLSENEIADYLKEVKTAYGGVLNIPKYLDEDFLWFTGIVATDGSLHKQVDKRTRSIYYKVRVFNKNEGIIQRCIKILHDLGLRPYIYKRHGITCIEIGSTLLARILENFAIPSKDKTSKIKVPDFMFSLNSNLIGAYLAGVFDGDGNYTKVSNRVLIPTVSDEFARGIHDLLLRLGVFSEIIKIQPKPTIIRGEKVDFRKPVSNVQFSRIADVQRFFKFVKPVKSTIPTLRYSRYHGLSSYYQEKHRKQVRWVKVKNVRRISGRHKVYNLSIEDTENYLANNFILHNCGRAGRPQYDKYGEAVVIAKGRSEVEALFEEFIRAEPERITSKLATEPALRTHVLASIAAGYVNDADGLLDFMGQTFFAYQFGTSDVAKVIERVLDFLEREEMIRRQGQLLLATPFGERVSNLYIDPLSAVVLRDGIRGIAAKEPTDLGLLHLISHTPDMEQLYLRQYDYPILKAFLDEHADELLTLIPSQDNEPDKYEFFLAEVKTAQMLQAWLEETYEDDIHEQFGVGAGDIRRKVNTAEWLLYAAHELASLFKARLALKPLRKLRERVRYGVKEELLELVQLRGIGRVRARSLFKEGYQRLADIKRADERELAQVPYIGTEIARSIKQQVERGAEAEPSLIEA